ncbi:MAG: glycoside hydrolase family 16 protein [Propionibacteriales bacterium]|nr:glycoside hydrolase family 16 protein [Propionibacteriales bacterium]
MKPILAVLMLVLLVGAVAAPAAPAAPASRLRAAYTSDDCGRQPLKPDGTAWQCTFVDNFGGRELDRTKWRPQTEFVTGTDTVYACYRDDPANVSVKYGALNLTLVKLPVPAPCGVSGMGPSQYQSGMVSTWHLFSQQYGRFEARVKNTATTQPGLHEAFWMWPDDRYGSTDSGEIDVSETFSVHPTVSVAALHPTDDELGLRAGTDTDTCAARRGVWNTYTMEWSPTKIEFFVNGKSCLVNTAADPAFQKPYILNFTEAIGPVDMGNLPTAQTPTPATYKVDYVKVWQ